jgi:predicted Zn-dependent peptidase
MNIIRYSLAPAALVLLFAAAVFAQPSASQPRRDTLLNGLRVVMWPDSSSQTVEVRIRIHSGAAFDPQGREGVMKLLADNIFPTETAREYFKEDLGGSLEIQTTYDYIEIRATGRADAFLQMMETLASAVANPTIDKETTVRLRTALIESLKKYESQPAYVADAAIAKRLFGSFPYGRPVFGTQSSVAKIEFPDLIDAKQRFLSADNATVSLTGNFDRSLALKAVKRYFGAWLKSDKRTPSTFRQPDAPPAGVESVQSPLFDESGIRYAFRGVARRDKDVGAARIFAFVLADRLKGRAPGEHADDIFVRSEERILPGAFIIGFDIKRGSAGDRKLAFQDIVTAALAAPVTDAEFTSARQRFADDWHKKDTASFWLDADTYGISSVDNDMKAAESATLADVNAFAEKLRRSPMAAVLVNTPASAGQ